MTNNQPATDHEISIEKLTKTSVERQREFVARGWVYDMWGNCSIPQGPIGQTTHCR